MLRAEAYIKSQVVLHAWREAHHYVGHNTIIMVGCAIGHRVRSGWGTWLQVIDQIPIFSARKIEQQPSGQPDLMDPSVIRLLEAVDKIYDSTAEALSAGGLYWADLGEITNPWFLEKICRDPANHPRTA